MLHFSNAVFVAGDRKRLWLSISNMANITWNDCCRDSAPTMWGPKWWLLCGKKRQQHTFHATNHCKL